MFIPLLPEFWVPKLKLNLSTLFFTAEGQAQSKKLARRKAAIVVLEEMKKVIEAEEKEKPQQECSFTTTTSSTTFIRASYWYTVYGIHICSTNMIHFS